MTLGIIGLGRIGGRVCELMAPWKMRTLACDPYVDKDRFVRYGTGQADIETVFRESDIVSLHVTHTQETKRFIGKDLLSLMKPDSLFINTSRGAVVNEQELAQALEAGTPASAAVDVYEDEPLPHNSPLMNMGDKVLLSAHMVSSNVKSGGLHPGYQWATRSIISALNGEVPDNVFNKEVIPAWEEKFGGKKLLFGNEPTA
jgi:phosphoglycerate dehydrogenase-like enzyme